MNIRLKLFNDANIPLRLILLHFTYIIGCIFLFPFYKYQINPDGVSYLSIAEHYLRGDFESAINACWSPLMSWLLVPLLFAGFAPISAAKFLLLITGLVTLEGVRKLSYRFEMTERLRYFILFSFIPSNVVLGLSSCHA